MTMGSPSCYSGAIAIASSIKLEKVKERLEKQKYLKINKKGTRGRSPRMGEKEKDEREERSKENK